MNHPFFCVGHNWKPYQYYSGDIDFPEDLSKLAFDILQRIAPSYISAWNVHSPDTAIVNWYPPDSSLALHQDNSESSQLIALGSPIITVAIGTEDARLVSENLKTSAAGYRHQAAITRNQEN